MADDIVSSTERVYAAVRELRAQDQIATRETVAELSQLRQVVVDDRLRALTNQGRLRRVKRGVYDLQHSFGEPRVISKTVLPDGTVKYDIGDEVLTLTPHEARILAELSVGAAYAAVAIASTRDLEAGMSDIQSRVQRMEFLLGDRVQPRVENN